MFHSVAYVRTLCQQRNIPISQLEKDCGFSNGYLNPKKISKISYDRARIIADYLDVPLESILNGPEGQPTQAHPANASPAPQPAAAQPSADILDDVDIAFYGDYRELSEDDKETLRAMAKLMKERRARK